MTSDACLGLFILGFFLFVVIYGIKYGDWKNYDPSLCDPDDPFPPPEADDEQEG